MRRRPGRGTAPISALRIGVAWGRPSDVGHGTALDDASPLHDRDAVRDIGDDAHVVGDEQDAETALVGEVADKLEDLRLDGHVERGRRLVGNQQLRVAGQGRRDDDALALAAGELVRIGREPALGLGDPDGRQELERARPRASAAADAEMVAHGLAELARDREERVQARHRILEDRADVPAPARYPPCGPCGCREAGRLS